jgi:hypothetical protein
VTIESAEPSGGGVIVLGEKSTLTSEGCPLASRATEDEYLLIEFIMTVALAVLPALILTLEGDTLIPKSPGTAVTSRVRS